MQRIPVFVLIIYILFSWSAKGQNLRLEIHGKDTVETSVVDSLGYVEFHESYKSISDEVDRVISGMQEIGYLDVMLLGIVRTNDSLFTANLYLNEQYDSVRIYYDELPKVLRNKTNFKENAHYITIPFSEVKPFLRSLNLKITNKGRPFSSVQLKNIQKTESGVQAKLSIKYSKKRQIDKIIIKGYEKFPRSFLEHFIGLKTGLVFNKKKLNEKIERLENLRFASSIKPPQVQFAKDSTAIYLYLKKEKSNTFDGFLGFSNEEEGGGLNLTGHVEVLLLNNLNFGESLHLEYNDSKEQVRFNANLGLPYLFNTPFGVELGLEIFKKDSSFTTVAQRADLNYQIDENFSVLVGYRGTSSNNLMDSEQQSAGTTIKDFSTNYVTLGGAYVEYTNTEGLFLYKTRLHLKVGMGSRKQFQRKTKQWRLTSDFSHIFRLNRRNSVYVHNKSSVLFSDNYLSNELFRFGGINSLRGFTENSIAASLFSAFQTEYRFLLSKGLYIHSIVDYAYFKNKTLDMQENLYGVGFGIGLQTGAGLLKLSFANGKSDGQQFKFSNTKVHVSLTTVF